MYTRYNLLIKFTADSQQAFKKSQNTKEYIEAVFHSQALIFYVSWIRRCMMLRELLIMKYFISHLMDNS
jgi:hypothetical protein